MALRTNQKVSDLTPNPQNPRTITEAKLNALKAALHEFGDLGGFVYNRKSKKLVGGHQRARVFDPKTPIVIEKKYSKPTKVGTVAEGFIELKGERFKYREVEWDSAIEKAANIAANKGAGEWDNELLTDWFKDIDSLDFDLDLTMFDEDERAKFLGKDKKGLIDDDEVPDKAPARTKLGQIWQLGSHRLMCGDSTNEITVAKLMNGEKADMVFTDPPYGISNDTAKGATYNNNNKAYDDSTTFDLSKLKFESDFVIWGGQYYQDLPQARNKIGWVVWDKRPTRENWDEATRESANRIFGSHFEIAICKCKFAAGKIIRKTWGGFYGTAGKPEDAIVHRTQKPVELLSHFVNEKHRVILDYFGGSGSTLIACEKTNRKCFMMELDPHYCDVIIERWEKFTGQKAKLTTTDKQAKKSHA
jgi:DNA modification methylase